MGRDGVEDFAAGFVFVEAVIDEVAQIAAALGAAPGVGVGDAGGPPSVSPPVAGGE